MRGLNKIALIVEYDGRHYHGFQWQANAPTIQCELERAIKKLTGEERRVVTASRTDAETHAKGQVASFWVKSTLPQEVFVKALNYYLPTDIAVKSAHKISNDFDVRRDAISREYEYYILNRPVRSPLTEGFAYFVARELNVSAMNKACHVLQGEHDFTSFVTSLIGIKSTVRNFYEAKAEKRKDLIVFRFVANSFLPHQIRNTVGLLIRVGLGKIDITGFQQILEAKKPGLAGPTVPAYGLYLTKINYPKPFPN